MKVNLKGSPIRALFTPTTRKGDYFRGEMPFNNNTGAMWLTITNVAVLNDGSNPDIVTNVVGSLLLAKTPETFTYDADGNLTSDSLWTNVWNGENRRITVESRSTLPAAAKVKEQWTILADGRWVERIVSTNNGTSYYPAFTNRYVWDNQVLLAVLDHTNGVVVSFMRGLDLSGSIQGAGGVGGVLAVKVGTAVPSGPLANTTHFTCYDGNGNVTALMNAATGEESARYEYAPFAEKLRETGPMAKLNPIRFSTQYHDDYTEDDKYVFRDLRDGRWLSRDPIEERGGANVNGFLNNQPLTKRDYLGLYDPDDPSDPRHREPRCRVGCPGCDICRPPSEAPEDDFDYPWWVDTIEVTCDGLSLISIGADVATIPSGEGALIAGALQGLKYKCKKHVKQKCLCTALYNQMKATCGQAHSCNEDGHSSEYYAARLAVAIGCEAERALYQKKCWKPKSDPRWDGHMQKIAEERRAIKKCSEQLGKAMAREAAR